MKLSVLERIVALTILPDKGSFTTLKIVREAREALSFTEEEHKLFEMKHSEDGMVTWNPETVTDKEFIFGEVFSNVMKTTLEKLDKEEKLEERHVSLYEKFVGA